MTVPPRTHEPVLIAVGGLVASGKSSVARRLAERREVPLLVTDQLRLDILVELGDHDSREAVWQRGLSPDFAEEVYGDLLRRAEKELAWGRPPVLDGCFSRRRQRLAARALGASAGVDFRFVECCARSEVLRERLRARSRRGGLPEAVWLRIRDELLGQWEPVDELAPAEHRIVDTGRPLDQSVSEVLAWLDGVAARGEGTS
jgi:predicted kinase